MPFADWEDARGVAGQACGASAAAAHMPQVGIYKQCCTLKPWHVLSGWRHQGVAGNSGGSAHAACARTYRYVADLHEVPAGDLWGRHQRLEHTCRGQGWRRGLEQGRRRQSTRYWRGITRPLPAHFKGPDKSSRKSHTSSPFTFMRPRYTPCQVQYRMCCHHAHFPARRTLPPTPTPGPTLDNTSPPPPPTHTHTHTPLQVDYLVGCHYDGPSNQLLLMAGHNDGPVAFLPLVEQQGPHGAMAGAAMACPMLLLAGGHNSVVRSVHCVGDGTSGPLCVSGGEDALVCLWTLDQALAAAGVAATAAAAAAGGGVGAGAGGGGGGGQAGGGGRGQGGRGQGGQVEGEGMRRSPGPGPGPERQHRGLVGHQRGKLGGAKDRRPSPY